MSATKGKQDGDLTGVNQVSMKELSQVLAKHFGLPPGAYDLRIEFKIGTGPVGPDDERLPGVVLGVQSIGLGRARLDVENPRESAPVLEASTQVKAKRPPRVKSK